ncbi:MAG: MBL fold metallo-hydrolase [Desulfurococcaceae archaeon]
MARLLVLVDERVKSGRLVGRYGLSLLIDVGQQILFDAGPSPEALEHNAGALGVDLSAIEAVIVSHEHSDHVGGLEAVGRHSPYARAYIPYGTWEGLGRLARRLGLDPVEVHEDVQVGPGVFVTRSFYGPPFEQFAVLMGRRGPVLISGCFHPRKEEVLRHVEERYGRPAMLVGGLHLSNAPDEAILRTARALAEEFGIKRVVPLHCSGERAARAMEGLGIEVVKLRAGDELEV